MSDEPEIPFLQACSLQQLLSRKLREPRTAERYKGMAWAGQSRRGEISRTRGVGFGTRGRGCSK
jgi:hypothetical protein